MLVTTPIPGQTLSKTGETAVSLTELAGPFSRYVCEHLRICPTQATSPSSRFLDACRMFNAGELQQDELIDTTVKLGFNNVFAGRIFLRQAGEAEASVAVLRVLSGQHRDKAEHGQLWHQAALRERLHESIPFGNRGSEMRSGKCIPAVETDKGTAGHAQQSLILDRAGVRMSQATIPVTALRLRLNSFLAGRPCFGGVACPLVSVGNVSMP